MTRNQVVRQLQAIADAAPCSGAKWYIFGSALEHVSGAADIDIRIVCKTDADADAIRRHVDPDEFYRPLHLAILTEAEEAEIFSAASQAYLRVW